MPSQPYNLVKDEPDLRVPLHSDEAFFNGISFQAKVCDLFLNDNTFIDTSVRKKKHNYFTVVFMKSRTQIFMFQKKHHYDSLLNFDVICVKNLRRIHKPILLI